MGRRRGVQQILPQFSPDGDRLFFGVFAPISGGGPGFVDVETGELLAFFPGSRGFGPSFSRDGSRVAFELRPDPFASGDMEVWDLRLSRRISAAPMDTGFVNPGEGVGIRGIVPLALSEDGRLLATVVGDAKDEVRLWNAETLTPLHTLTGHTAAVTDIAFSPDGTRLVTASLDGTARVWDIDTGRLVFMAPAERSGVYAAAFSQDASRIIAVYADGRIIAHAIALEDVIAIANARVTRSLTHEECRIYLHVPACPS